MLKRKIYGVHTILYVVVSTFCSQEASFVNICQQSYVHQVCCEKNSDGSYPTGEYWFMANDNIETNDFECILESGGPSRPST